MARPRAARGLPAALAPVIAAVAKALPHLVPHVLTAGYMIYQEVKIAWLETPLDVVRDRMQKVAVLLFNSSDIESEAVAAELNTLIQHQKIQQLQ